MNEVDTVISGKLLLSDGTYTNGSLAIHGEKIVSIGAKEAMPHASREYDFKNLTIMPGVIDVHFHAMGIREEGYVNATKSALAGGVTTVNDMPLHPGGGDPIRRQEIEDKKAHAKENSITDFCLLAGVLSDQLESISEASSAGITGYKLLMHSTNDPTKYRIGAADDFTLWEAFKEISKTGLRALVHAENDTIINKNARRYISEGKTHPKYHSLSRPPFTETEAVGRAIEFTLSTGVNLHLVHLSVPKSIDLVTKAREQGVNVTCETAPHYLTLTDERWSEIGMLFKINPPLRSAEMREGLWDKLKNGRMTLIASDHAPHNIIETDNVFEGLSGTPGVETMLSLIHSEGVVKNRISIQDMSRCLSQNPALLLGIYGKKGAIQIGFDADIVVFDTDHSWIIEGSGLKSQCGWTAFEGMRVTGKPIATFLRGRCVYKDGEVLGKPGFGKFVKHRKAFRL